jgi:hypothetical protein
VAEEKASVLAVLSKPYVVITGWHAAVRRADLAAHDRKVRNGNGKRWEPDLLIGS